MWYCGPSDENGVQLQSLKIYYLPGLSGLTSYSRGPLYVNVRGSKHPSEAYISAETLVGSGKLREFLYFKGCILLRPLFSFVRS